MLGIPIPPRRPSPQTPPFTAKLTTTPHNPQTLESNIVDATCDKDGSKTVTTSCSDCGYVISENNVVIPATGHKWGEWKHDDSTAKAESKHTHICENDATHTEERLLVTLLLR